MSPERSRPTSLFPLAAAAFAAVVTVAAIPGPIPTVGRVAAVAVFVAVYAWSASVEIIVRQRSGGGRRWSVLPRPVLDSVVDAHRATRDHEDALRAAIQRERIAGLELEIRAAAAAEAQRRVEELNAELEAFTFSASHDLAVPLTTIRAFVALLEESDGHRLGEEGREYLGRVGNIAARMEELIGDLLALSRMRRDADPEPALVDVRGLVDEVAVEVERALGRPLDVRVVGDVAQLLVPPSLLRAILQNLIHNGAKYNDHERPSVTVLVDAGDRFASLVVMDDGIGVADDDRERIFELFVRGTDHLGLPGTGAGLAIARRAARSLGGDLWLETTGAEGTTFCVTIPRPAVPEHGADRSASVG